MTLLVIYTESGYGTRAVADTSGSETRLVVLTMPDTVTVAGAGAVSFGGGVTMDVDGVYHIVTASTTNIYYERADGLARITRLNGTTWTIRPAPGESAYGFNLSPGGTFGEVTGTYRHTLLISRTCTVS
jgi:hypothetical protein